MTTDGHAAYVRAVEGAFGMDVDYATLVKLYGSSPESAKGRYSPAECIGVKLQPIQGSPDRCHINTSYGGAFEPVDPHGQPPLQAPDQYFSKKIDKQIHMLSLYFAHYNFCRIHKTLGVTPALAAGVSDTVRDMDSIVGLIDAVARNRNRAVRYNQHKAIAGSPINATVTLAMADARKLRA